MRTFIIHTLSQDGRAAAPFCPLGWLTPRAGPGRGERAAPPSGQSGSPACGPGGPPVGGGSLTGVISARAYPAIDTALAVHRRSVKTMVHSLL